MAQEVKIDFFETKRKNLEEERKQNQKLLQQATDTKDQYMKQLKEVYKLNMIMKEVYDGEYLINNQDLDRQFKAQMDLYIKKHGILQKDIKGSKEAERTLKNSLNLIDNELSDLELQQLGGNNYGHQSQGTAGNV